MDHAKHTAANQGWELYRSITPRPTRDEINAVLETDHLPSISLRMYDHYRRLVRHDVNGYMPINEFDIALKNGRIGRRSA
ncbi:MAG: hypothetical protein ACRDWD_01545 [Acidimicrobiia bacterium]